MLNARSTGFFTAVCNAGFTCKSFLNGELLAEFRF